MKKVILVIFVLLLVAAGVVAFIFLGSATGFKGKKATLYISSHAATKKAVIDSLEKNHIVSNQTAFEFLADRMDYWKSIKPGKYEIDKGTSLLSLVRRLRNGRQTPVDLVITKLRTREDFARVTARKFEFDSAAMMDFLNNSDTLALYHVDSSTSMTVILPDTYTFFWTATPHTIFEKLYTTSSKFWTDERTNKAAALGFTPQQVYTLASIIEEETTNNEEKDTIASVYINRINKGMPLQADPTVKFALKDFGLKRIYQKHLTVASPYNTYQNKGLPPGPICTPSRTTIEAVLQAPATNYLYFVASPSFKQAHEFSETYAEHLQKAKRYQQALNMRQKEAQESK